MKKYKRIKTDIKYALPETNPELNNDLEVERDIKSEDDLDIIYDESNEDDIENNSEENISIA